ncbi:hypothetical protein ASG37_07440 [Sphingomonas sp. Leaf407]|nr:hypothetical protein ASE97_04730 [Sphingomonas sp. Leaf42]KQT28674.1 hypothetical protein ASG37_07440 [Sphingomonas sp. Leaf407]
MLDPYAAAFNAMDGGKASGDAVGGLIAIALLQGALCYWGVRRWLNYRARADRLPAWIYGWATDIANAADNDDRLILAYVMTTHDIDQKAITYVGVLYDLVLKADGCITRLTLWDCERYLADLAVPVDRPTLPEPLSRFPFLMLEASHIRNVAFEILDVSGTPPSTD